jgi:cytochrome P450
VQYDPRTDRWLVPRHADVDALLRDRRLGRTYLHVATHAEMGRPEEPPEHAPFWRVIRNGMLDVEPPDHTRLRRLVSRAFTPRTVERLRGTGAGDRRPARRRRARAGGVRPADDRRRAAAVTVIAEMLGVPRPTGTCCGRGRPTSAACTSSTRPSRPPPPPVRACEEFGDYLVALSRERRARPQDDLVTALTQVVDDGDVLTEDELVGTCVLLLNAGHEATVGVTGNGWWSLFRTPDQLARLRADPSLLPPPSRS